MSHPTDFPPIAPPAPTKAVATELTVRIMHPGAIWKATPEEFCQRAAQGIARLTAQLCGGTGGQQVTVEVIPVRKGIEPQLVSGTISSLLRNPASGIGHQESGTNPQPRSQP